MLEEIPLKYRYKIVACYVSFLIYAFVNFLIFHGRIHGQENIDVERLVKIGILIAIYGMSIFFLTKKKRHILAVIFLFGLVVPFKHILTYWTLFIENISTASMHASVVFYGQFIPILGASVLLLSSARNYYREVEKSA